MLDNLVERWHGLIGSAPTNSMLANLVEKGHSIGSKLTNLLPSEALVIGYSVVLNINPDSINALIGRANAYSQLGRHGSALFDYNEAIRLNPGDASLYNNRGVELYNLGRYDEAIRDFKKAIELEPDIPLQHANLGDALRKYHRIAEAIQQFSEVLGLIIQRQDGLTINDRIAASRAFVALKPLHLVMEEDLPPNLLSQIRIFEYPHQTYVQSIGRN
ncbi:tetratricopeptide repeat protein [Candidatus Woesearchaeota archaeon]|nr:tetratricopeptide repeat protein [Candidatus Woesearchaeota archaeon]